MTPPDDEALIATLQLLLGDMDPTRRLSLIQAAFSDDLIIRPTTKKELVQYLTLARTHVADVRSSLDGQTPLSALAAKNLGLKLTFAQAALSEFLKKI